MSHDASQLANLQDRAHKQDYEKAVSYQERVRQLASQNMAAHRERSERAQNQVKMDKLKF